MPTTAQMVEAAQDSHDVAAGDEAVAWTKLVEAIKRGDGERAARAKWIVAFAAADYALSVLRSVQADHLASLEATA